MSGKLPTVITYYAEPTEQRKLDIKCEILKENTGRWAIKRRPLVAKQPQSDCGNIRNPWLLRCGVAFVAIVFVVIFVALYSKLHAKVETLEVKFAALQEKINELKNRIDCSVVRVNGTDRRGGSCSQHAPQQVLEPFKVRPTKRFQTTKENKHRPTSSWSRATDNVKHNCTKANQNTVYVAWGVAKCPRNEGTRTLYSGTVASSEESEFLCLPSMIHYGNPKDISNTDRAQLHPVTYGESMILFGPPWNGKKNHARNDSEVPCAVCRHSGRSAALVAPAASNCPTGEWQREYRGYLMSAETQQKRAEFICVNIYAESKQTRNGRLQGPATRLQLTQYDYEPADERDAALACVVCLI